jgi:uncharacterized protein YbbC (DUF1343 family)
MLAEGLARANWRSCKSKPLPRASGHKLGIDPSLTGDLDALLQDAVRSRQTEAAAALVVRRGKVFYRGVAGSAKVDTVWDLASVSKVITATSVMQLLERRRKGLTLETPVSRHLRVVDVPDKRAITVEQLLLHTSGLHSVVWRGPETDGRDAIFRRIQRSRLRATPGTRFRYSDIGYILLGELVGKVSGLGLAGHTRKRLFQPLGMCDTGYNPIKHRRGRLVSHWPEGGKEGQVYDPLAARLAGVAGHAGLYSTLDDLARFGQALLNGGALEGRRVLSRASVEQMIRGHRLPASRSRRGLGWQLNLRQVGSTRQLSRRAYGHGGYTGSNLWIDPQHELVLVLLTNRTRITPLPSPLPLRARFHGLVLGAINRETRRPVRTGLDRLVRARFRALAGRKVGLITNRTAVDRRGRWIVDLLGRAPRVQLKVLFVPEHGLAAKVDRHVRDSALGRGRKRLPVYSLFGKRRRPTDATLKGVDTLVFDVAAVGVRYYTYLATMGWAMEEAARRKIRFVVLDRPNPIGGRVQGPLATDRTTTSTNYHPLPVRYGMTVGELAQMYNRERRIRVKLKVVRLSGWRRGSLFPDLGVPWVNPSPNIRSWRQALLYSGVGLLEGTNLAVGRGTDAPFMLVGAPWIDGAALAREVNAARLKGVRAVPTSFTPRSSRYRDKLCRGVRLLLTDPRALDGPALGVALALALHKLHPDSWDTKRLGRLVRHPPTVAAILAGRQLKDVLPLWRRGVARFQKNRRRYLLY